MLDEPGDEVDARPRQAQPFAGGPGRARAGLLLAAGQAALARVVQQHGQEEDVLLLDLRHQGGGQGMLVGHAPAGDVGDHAHGPQGVLVHRIGVVHVELHLGDDASELRQIAPQHARLGHQGQRPLGIAAAGQDIQEDLRRLGVPPHLRADETERPGGGGEGVGVQVEVPPVGDLEQPQQVQRIGLEHLRPGHVQTPALLDEARHVQRLAGGLATAGEQARNPPGRGLDPFGLQLGGEDAGQRADLLGDQEIAPHEALDGRIVGPVAIAHPLGDLRLQVEGQALFGAAGGEMQVSAHRPEEIKGPDEGADFTPLEHLQLRHPVHRLGRVQIFGDPEEGVEVPQAPLALLHIGLDHVAAGAGAGLALIALLELGGDELRACALDHLAAEPGLQLLGQGLVAGQAPGLQDRGADGEVFPGELDALIHRARGVAHLEAQIPQGIEHVLDHALHMGSLLVGAQEQEIEIGEGRKRPAPIAPHRHQAQALALGGIARPDHVDGGEVIEGGDHLVGDPGQEPRGLDAAGPILQPLLGDHPAAKQGLLQDLQRPPTLLGLIAGRIQRRRRQLRPQPHPIDDIFQAGGFETRGHGLWGLWRRRYSI